MLQMVSRQLTHRSMQKGALMQCGKMLHCMAMHNLAITVPLSIVQEGRASPIACVEQALENRTRLKSTSQLIEQHGCCEFRARYDFKSARPLRLHRNLSCIEGMIAPGLTIRAHPSKALPGTSYLWITRQQTMTMLRPNPPLQCTSTLLGVLQSLAKVPTFSSASLIV